MEDGYDYGTVAKHRVYIFGGEEPTLDLVPMLVRVGFSVVVCENDAQFASKEIFPDAEEVIVGDYDQLISRIKPTDSDYVIVITRNHEHDVEVLEPMLQTPAHYVGWMASTPRQAEARQSFLAAGIPLERLYSPIGVPIKSKRPTEIAISIAAQMIQIRSGG